MCEISCTYSLLCSLKTGLGKATCYLHVNCLISVPRLYALVLTWVTLLLRGFSENTWELEEFLAKLWPRPWPVLEPVPNYCLLGHVAGSTCHTPITVLEEYGTRGIASRMPEFNGNEKSCYAAWDTYCKKGNKVIQMVSSMPRNLSSQRCSVHFELPHIFHERWCIEPWLLRYRTCLKCKCDLKATGTEVTLKNKSLVALTENGKRRSECYIA